MLTHHEISLLRNLVTKYPEVLDLGCRWKRGADLFYTLVFLVQGMSTKGPKCDGDWMVVEVVTKIKFILLI
jgi:hypothetical protein